MHLEVGPYTGTHSHFVEAHLLKTVMVNVDGFFRRRVMKPLIVMTIHDAVCVEAPEEEAAQATKILKDQMEAAVEMPVVPLDVDIE